MGLCDLSLAQVILTLSIGGITLRGAIAFLKKIFHAEGPSAVALTIGCCFLATTIYLFVTGALSIPCVVIIGMAVYAGSQAVYSLTKKRDKNETQA